MTENTIPLETDTLSQMRLSVLREVEADEKRGLNARWLAEAIDEIQELREQVAELKREVERLSFYETR